MKVRSLNLGSIPSLEKRAAEIEAREKKERDEYFSKLRKDHSAINSRMRKRRKMQKKRRIGKYNPDEVYKRKIEKCLGRKLELMDKDQDKKLNIKSRNECNGSHIEHKHLLKSIQYKELTHRDCC